VIAAIFEAQLTEEQAHRLVELMRETRPSRPEGVLNVSLLYERGEAQIVAIWRDRDDLERYLASSTPRAKELMRRVGAEPTVRLVPVLEHE
jgi:hypothetical protein